MKTKATLSFVSIVLGVSLGLMWMHAAEKPSPIGDYEIRPFTAHAMQVITGPDGYVGSWSQVQTIAQRGDGSYAKRQTTLLHSDALNLTKSEIWDVSLGRRSKISPAAKVVSSYHLDLDQPFPTPSGCTPAAQAAPEAGEFLGFRIVEVVRETEPTVSRMWFAPELNCLLVYAEGNLLDADGSVMQTNLYKVTAIQPGEPDPAFFLVPDEFEEMRPSEAFRRQLMAAGADEAKIERSVSHETMAYADAAYFASAWSGAAQ